MKPLALLFLALPLYAQTCTPLSVAANGPRPSTAIVNGVDNLTSRSVRILWTSSASSGSPATAQRVTYATNAEWAVSPGVYPHLATLWNSDPTHPKGPPLTDGTVIQGGIVIPLTAATGYHALPQSYIGGAWCTSSDVPFTTLADSDSTPVPPAQVDTTIPTVTGTDYVYNSTCGTSGTDTQRWNDCLSKANPDLGDGIKAPGGVYHISDSAAHTLNFPNRPSSVGISCNSGTNLCTQSGTPPAEGSQAVFSAPPSPVNPGIPYYLINVSTSAGPGTTGAFITSGALSGPRNDFNGYVGFQFTPATNLTINQLARWIIAGNNQTHILKLTDAATGVDLVGGNVTVNASGATTGAYLYGSLGSPITLQGGHPYYMSSQETNGGDLFYDVGTVTHSSSTGTIASGAYNNGTWGTLGTTDQSYGPVNFNVSAIGTLTTFNVSYDGSGAVTFAVSDTGDQYLPYPLPTSSVLIHSSAAANLLPPTGVRISTATIAQYRPNMIEFEDMDPTLGNGILNWSPLAGGYNFQNIVWSLDQSIATTHDATHGNGLDPIGYRVPLSIGSYTTNHQIVFDRNYFDYAGASGGPSRVYLIAVNGQQLAVINSTMNGESWWQPFMTTTAPSYNTSSATIQPFTLNWAGADGTAATKQSCTNPGATITITSGGGVTANPALVLGAYPDCTLTLDVATGVTVTTTGIATVTHSASPYYPPTYTYVGPSGGTQTGLLALRVANGAMTSGNLTSFTVESPLTLSQNALEEGSGFYIGGSGIGVYKWDNNFITGMDIVGPIFSNDIVFVTPCGSTNPCPMQYNPGDLTESRSTMTIPTTCNPDLPTWNGTNCGGRNYSECKMCDHVAQIGNIYGPGLVATGLMQCSLHETYQQGNENSFYGIQTGFPNYAEGSNWLFAYNTCFGEGAAIATGFSQNYGSSRVQQNTSIHDNLFLDVNGYAASPATFPFGANSFGTGGSCAAGYQLSLQTPQVGLAYTHNTIISPGGCLPTWLYLAGQMPAKVLIQNNAIGITTDPGGTLASAAVAGVYSHAENLTDPCGVGTVGQAALSCIGELTFVGNGLVGFYSDSKPSSITDLNTSDINTIISSYYSSYTSTNPTAPNQNTLALRNAYIQYFNPSVNNYRHKPTSPWISGSHPVGGDGKDIGVDMDMLAAQQGEVSNVRVLATTSTSATIGFYAPDSFACELDWSSDSWATWTRVAGAAGSPDVRVQSVSLTGLPAHGTVAYRVECQVQQPTGTVTLP